MPSIDLYELLRRGPTAPGRGQDVLVYSPSEGVLAIATGGTRNGVTLASDLVRFNADGTLTFTGAVVNTGDLATSGVVEAFQGADRNNAPNARLSVVGGVARLLTGRTGTGTEPATLAIASALGDIVSIDTATGAVSFNYPTTLGGVRIGTGNLLTNGGFEVWQRGTGPFTTNNAYGPDRWLLNISGGGSMSVSRDSANADAGSEYCAAITYTHLAPSALQQAFATEGTRLGGRTLTLTMRVRCNAANAVRAGLYNGSAFVYSSYHTGGGAYETLTVTATLAAGITNFQARLQFDATSTAYLDNCTLVTGSVAADYVPLHPADDLARCQRYYEVLGSGANNESFGVAQAYSASAAVLAVRYMQKAVVPTITISTAGNFGAWTANAGAVNAFTGMTLASVATQQSALQFTGASGLVAGDASHIQSSGGTAARIYAEANP